MTDSTGPAAPQPPDVRFLTFEDVRDIHADELAKYGGRDGIIDEGVIRAAVAAPQHAYHYSGGDITQAAAAYLYSLAAQQGFVDGNKRTALHAALEFLFVNGYQLNCPSDDAYQMTMRVGNGLIKRDGVAAWMVQWIAPIP